MMMFEEVQEDGKWPSGTRNPKGQGEIPVIDLKLLGPPEIYRDGKPVRLLKKTEALLAFLSMEQARHHERAYLSDLFWPDFPQSRADHSLRQSLHSLRKALDLRSGPPLFPKSGSSVGLNPDHPLRTDALRLLRPPASCPVFHDPERCPSCELQIQNALLEIRGPFMEGLSLPDCEEFESWLTGTREGLFVRVRWGVERLIHLYEKNGRTDLALSVLDRALRMDPLDEAFHGRTMLFLAETGNRTAALHQYETCRRILHEQLGTEPTSETRAILKKILSAPQTLSGIRMDGAGGTLPDLPLAPEWRPATALYLALEAGGEEDPEEISSAVGEALGRVAEAAKSLGGVIGRIHDNGVLAWFGIRGQPEGAARRAVRTALEIGKTVGESLEGVFRGMVLRAGIHSGRILRSDPTDPPDPTGAVSRTAMSLCMQAKGGAVLVSGATAPLLRGQFRLSEAEDLLVLGVRRKGFFLLELSEGEVRGKDRPPLFGRERELKLFSELWERSRGEVLSVEGEAGIGKSALVFAFLEIVNPLSAQVRRIECGPQYTDSPLFPVLRLIREIAGIPEGLESEAAYARLVSYVRSIGHGGRDEERTAVALLGSFFSLPPHPDFPLPPLSAAALREEISGIILTLLRARAETGSYVLLVEDLHWVDASTGDLLRRILSDPFFTGRIFFLLTTRTGEAPPWLTSLPDVRTIRLSPLAEADSRSLIRALSPKTLLSDAEASRIVETADGVPLFIEELTREAVERRSLPPSTGTLSVPATLGEVLASRLDRLASARPILQRAALYGRTVPLDLLRALSPEPPDLFEALLDRAVLSGLVRRETDLSGEIATFRHALIEVAARESLPKPARRALHAKIAETLRDRFPDRADANPEIAAFHFEGAEEWGEAVSWYEKAAHRTFIKGAFLETEHLLRKALEILPRCPPSTESRTGEIRILTAQGMLLIELYGHGSPMATQVFRKALSLIEPGVAVSEDTFYALYGYFETLFGKTDLREIRRVADSLVELARRSGSADLQSVAFFCDGNVAFWEGRFSDSLSLLDRSLALKERHGGQEGRSTARESALAGLLPYRLWGLWFCGRYRSAATLLQSIMKPEDSSPPSFKGGYILTISIVLLRYFRLPARIISAADRLSESIQSLKAEAFSSTEEGFRGWAMVLEGNPAGISLILRGLRLSRKYHRIAEIKYLSMLSEAYLSLGDSRRSRGVADSALRFSEKSGAHFFDAELWRMRGEAALLEGKREEARECFGRAMEISRSQGARALELRAVTSMGKILVADGERKKALELMSGVVDLIEGPESAPSLPDIREALELKKRLS